MDQTDPAQLMAAALMNKQMQSQENGMNQQLGANPLMSQMAQPMNQAQAGPGMNAMAALFNQPTFQGQPPGVPGSPNPSYYAGP